MSDASIQVRISAATPEADLAAAVWPGVTSVIYPRVESALQIQLAEARLDRLERLRGMRPGHVRIQPSIESSRGVTDADKIVSSSPRVDRLAVGPAITLELGEDSLGYARGECELHARAQRVVFLDPFAPYD
jgi:citrate lyase subunit beta / citryl-CoA lyase